MAWALFLFCAAVTSGAQGSADQTELANLLKDAANYHQKADYTHSIPRLRRIVQMFPRDYLGNLLLGEDLLHSGDVRASIYPFEMASASRPEDGVAKVYLAEAEDALGNYAAATEALQTALIRGKGAPAFVQAWGSHCLERLWELGPELRKSKRGEADLLRAEAAFRGEGESSREALLEESAAGDPDQRGIWGELGTAQLELGKHAEALESLKKAEQRDPHGAETLQLEALVAAIQQDWPGAERYLREMAAHSPAEFHSTVELWRHAISARRIAYGVGWPCLRDTSASCPAELSTPQGGKGLGAKALYDLGRWEQLLALPKPVPANGSAALWRGVALARTGQCSNAIPWLERGIQTDELTAGFWLDVCYANEGNIAIAQLSRAGETAAVHQMKGDILLRMRFDTKGALAQYDEALKSEPRNPHLLERVAEAYMTEGETEKARQAAMTAVELAPHDVLAIKTLAYLNLDERDYAGALPWLKQLIDIHPKDSWTQMELGATYGHLGRYEEALRYMEPLLKAGYEDSKGALHAQLAIILRKVGRKEDAAKAEAEAQMLANRSLEGIAPQVPDVH